MVVVLAEAKTSAGAPELICCASAELAAKLNVTFTPGWAASNCCPIVVNASFSDDAAKTVMLPVTDGLGDPVPPAPAEPPLLLLDPHAESIPAATRIEAATSGERRRMATGS
jgi:hypothetical protein